MKTIEVYINAEGNADCKAKLDKIKEKVAEDKNVERETKIKPEPPVTATDADATTNGSDIGVDGNHKSPDAKPDGTRKERTEDEKKKIEDEKKKLDDRRKE